MKIKESAKIVLLTALLAAPFTATTQASDFFGGNDGEWKMGPNGPYWDESDWPVWTPMYWMEEMMDSFDDDDDNNMWGGGGGNRFGNNMPFGNMMPYGNNTPNYGYGMPYGAPVPAPAVPVRPTIPQSATPAAK